MKRYAFFLVFATSAFAADYGYLKPSDQKYFKNDQMEGLNKQERIDQNVKAINKLFGEIEAMKAEINQLKSEVAELKAKK